MINDKLHASGRILVVDDEERNRKLLRRFLESKGYVVHEAVDGIDALECVEKELPDVILLDVMMPRMDGFSVCRRLKDDPQTAHIPILLVTMLSDRKDRLAGIEAGANDFLSKPVDLNETLLRVRNAVMLKRLFDENIFYQHELEKLVDERTKALRQAFEELKSSQEQIIHQEKLATIGQLSAGVAHEINTPTSYIALNLSSLNDSLDQLYQYQQSVTGSNKSVDDPAAIHSDNPPQSIDPEMLFSTMREMVADSLEGTRRIGQIVKSLNSFSRREDNIASLADINECIENTLKFVWNELKYKATVVKNYGELPKISCYPQSLSQVFMNLLVNAAHAIEKNGTITITTFCEDNVVVVEITDTGSGISDENKDKIFEAFFTTKTLGKGTGLGLSIASKIVQKHQGEMSVSSILGEGTTFTVRLPVVVTEDT